MSRSAARHSPRFSAEKPAPPQPVLSAQPTATPSAPTTEAEAPSDPGAWIAMLIWFAAFLGLTLTVWFDYIYGIFRR